MLCESQENDDILPDNTKNPIDPQNLVENDELNPENLGNPIDPQVQTLVDSLVSKVAKNEIEAAPHKKKEKKSRLCTKKGKKAKSSSTNSSSIFQDDDPGEIAVAYSFEEMNRIFEEYKTRTCNGYSTSGKKNLHSGLINFFNLVSFLLWG